MYSIHLDLYNVGFQGNQVQIYSICTLLHLFIKNVSRKHSPSISCLVLAQYMLKNIVYIYLIYVYIHNVHIPFRKYRTSNAGFPINVAN